MMRPGMIILVGGLMAAACSSVPSYRPAPLQTASGKLGFSVSGIASFTRDEAKVTEVFDAILDELNQLNASYVTSNKGTSFEIVVTH